MFLLPRIGKTMRSGFVETRNRGNTKALFVIQCGWSGRCFVHRPGQYVNKERRDVIAQEKLRRSSS